MMNNRQCVDLGYYRQTQTQTASVNVVLYFYIDLH